MWGWAMPTIIISYRRDDTRHITGRIFDRLEQHYGKGQVFMDIDNIPYGMDFRRHLLNTLDACDALVAIVGPNWIGADATGEPRICDPTDWVRIEIEIALSKDIPVIPVLIDRARMPKPHELPEIIEDFAYRQGADLDTGRDFNQHMDRLIHAISQGMAHRLVETKQRGEDEERRKQQAAEEKRRKEAERQQQEAEARRRDGQEVRRQREDAPRRRTESVGRAQQATEAKARQRQTVPVIVTSVFVLAALGLAFAAVLWSRAPSPQTSPQSPSPPRKCRFCRLPGGLRRCRNCRLQSCDCFRNRDGHGSGRRPPHSRRSIWCQA